MRAATIASSLFAALAMAAPATAAPASKTETSENIEILKFIVRKDASPDGTKVKVVNFKLNGRDAKGLDCIAQAPVFPKPTEVATCGDSKYRFSLHAGTRGNDFSLRIYHELGLAVGYWGQGNVPTYCRAGGDGPRDFVCSQVAPTTIVIDSTPPPVQP